MTERMSSATSDEDLANGLEARAGALTQAMTVELNDASVAVRATWRQASALVAQIGGVAAQAAKQASSMRVDAADAESRGGHEQGRVLRSQAAELEARAQQGVDGLAAKGFSLTEIAVAQAKSSVVPAPPKDATEQVLARQLIDVAVGSKRGLAATAAILEVLADPGVKDSVVAEAFGPYGIGLMATPGGAVKNDPHDSLKVFARDGITRVLQRHPRSVAQIDKLSGPARGAIAAARASANIRLGGK